MGAPQIHDKYGKEVFQKAFGSDFDSSPAPYSFGTDAGTARIDGTVHNQIAVEIESRASKQVRGALVDIALHRLPLKLVVIIPAYGNRLTQKQCQVILERICKLSDHFEVIALNGNGKKPDLKQDAAIVSQAVKRLLQKKIRTA
jgi:hypothetical protein